jgi:16S rRNA A1518/A1519 N6-dimethyltransferase RsmA/KsgA/DIM1 with predicted DNA glycosylase/AP lyase activity
MAEFVEFVQAGFKQPRKILANSLADGLGVTRIEAVEYLRKAEIDPARRPQALDLTEWVRLFRGR